MGVSESEFNSAWDNALIRKYNLIFLGSTPTSSTLKQDTPAKDKVNLKKVAVAIEEINEPINVVAQDMIEVDPFEIADYFPVTEMETLEKMRKKSQEDKNFKGALVSFSIFNLTTFCNEEYPGFRKNSLANLWKGE